MKRLLRVPGVLVLRAAFVGAAGVDLRVTFAPSLVKVLRGVETSRVKSVAVSADD